MDFDKVYNLVKGACTDDGIITYDAIIMFVGTVGFLMLQSKGLLTYHDQINGKHMYKLKEKEN